MEEVKDAIPEHRTQLGKDQANDLQYEATGAASKIKIKLSAKFSTLLRKTKHSK